MVPSRRSISPLHVETFVAADSDSDGTLEALGLALQVLGTALNSIDEHEGGSLCCVSPRRASTMWGNTTYVNNFLDGTQHSGNGLSNDGHGVEETSLADENVQENLVDPDELAEGVENGIRRGTGGDIGHALHLRNGDRGGAHNVGEPSDQILQDHVSTAHGG